ncbi:uncharacterized protein [Choristoneura fumiferana]|uniref:uncharacterized protein n=1 Tax=Choristoneura fumiferana TaxID=7141 RepID=UPI003D157E04
MNALVICLWSVLLTAHAREVNSDADDSTKGFPITLPADCLGRELCLTKPIDYPSDAVDRVARQIQSRPKRHYEQATENFDERNSCTSSLKLIQPFVAIYNETRHLVIQSDFYKQTIPSVTCRNEGAGCLRDYKFSGNRPSCKTKFSSVNLCVLDSKKSSFTNINVTFPVDCECGVNDKD